MKRSLTILLFCALIGTSICGQIMPWMCLERCGENIQNDLQQATDHKNILTAMSFEDYDLGANSQLIYNGFTSVNEQIQNLGLGAYPMITTVNLSKLRQLFSNPDPFIADAVSRAVEYNYTGYNIDFEPTDRATEADAQAYAQFLDRFAKGLHAKAKLLSVCVASWNTFWNFTAIASTEVDKVLTMDTYAGSINSFTNYIEKAVNTIGVKKLGVGLITANPNNNQPFSIDEMNDRFNLIYKYGVGEVDIWQMPVPNNWWPLLKSFRNS